MSDAEDDVHVCDICQEIFLGNDELEEHMKEDHAMKEEPAAKEKNGHGEKERKRSRSSSGEERRREEKKMKKHKHRDRSRSRERHKEKKHDRKSSMDGFIDDGDAERNKLKKFLDKGHNFDADKGTIGVAKKAFASEGTVQEHDNLDGPQCPKCDQICKDNANLKNHILSHYYHDFYRVTPDTKPFPCPTCGKENRDRITMIRHFAFSHGMIFELTDVTPEMLNSTGKSRGPRAVNNTPRKEKEEKHVKRYDSDSDDEKFKQRMAANLANQNDKNSLEAKSSFGKHAKEHKHKKEKKEKKHKEHKEDRRHETEEERRIRKEKKRAEKDKERKARDGGANPLSMLSKELTPDSGSPAPSLPQESTWGEPKRRIAHQAQRSPSRSPERETAPPPPPPQAAADDSDEDDFGDLPAPVFAE